MTVKKHLRAQEIARENRLPCIYLVDSGGANLPHQTEVFPDRDHFGRIFYNQATLSVDGHPADRLRHGIVHGRRRLCAGHVGRDRHRAASGHDLPRRPSAGEGRNRARSSRQRISAARTSMRANPASPTTTPPTTCTRSRSFAASSGLSTPARPSISTSRSRSSRNTRLADLDAIVPTDLKKQYDIREVIARLVDGSEFDEFKRLYGTTLVTGFARHLGHAGRHHRQ